MERRRASCEQIRPLLAEGDGEPFPHDVEVHLATCRACAAEERRYGGIAGILAGMRHETEEVPPGLTEAVLARVHSPSLVWREHARRISHDPRARVAVAGLGGAVVGAAALAFLVRRRAARRPAAA